MHEVSSYQKCLAGDVSFHLKFKLKLTHSATSFEKRRLRQNFVYNISAVRASKKVQLSGIGSWPRAFQQAIYEVHTLYPYYRKFPKGWLKKRICRHLTKINLYQINSATKFLCVNTFSGKVVMNPFPITVRRCWR